MKYSASILIALALSFCIGCGGGSPVSGTVKFSDGTPLDTGRVMFESSSHSYMGSLGPQGKYTILGNQGKSGIPNGEYSVYIQAAEKADPNVTDPDAPPMQLIDKKFTNKNTSDLKCQVKGKTVFDITVEKP